MLTFIQVLISGIATGCIYGLIALSFVLIYKSTSTLSFMQGELMMVGAFIALALYHAAGWPLLFAATGSIIAMALLGAGLERAILHQALDQPQLTAVLLTFGCGLMLRGMVLSVPAATYDTHRLPLFDTPLQINIFSLSSAHLVIILATLTIAVLLALFFHRTRLGLGLRACAENPRAAVLCGVSVYAMHTLAWTLGTTLAALAGLLLAPITFIHPDMGLIALKAFPAAVLGGLYSLPGALIGGLFIGITEALSGLFLPEGSKEITPYLLLLVALLFFPDGLKSLSRLVHS